MFPLHTTTVPTTGDDWRAALAHAVARWITGPVRVEVEGQPPAFASVDADLSGGRLGDAPPPDVTIASRVGPGPSIDRLRVVARPLVVRGIPVALDVSANAVAFGVGRNAAGEVVLKLASATDGRASAHLAAADVDAALLAAARAGAKPHGVDIQSVHAAFTARGPRDVAVVLDVKAKKFMTFTLRVTGRLRVDDALTATATDLRVDGSGMAATVAAGILRSQLQKIEGQPTALAALNLGDVRLRDVAVDVTDGVRLTATFGGAA